MGEARVRLAHTLGALQVTLVVVTEVGVAGELFEGDGRWPVELCAS